MESFLGDKNEPEENIRKKQTTMEKSKQHFKNVIFITFLEITKVFLFALLVSAYLGVIRTFAQNDCHLVISDIPSL